MIRRPAAILALLTALNLLNYLDRYVLSSVLPLLKADLKLDNFQAGTLGTVFLVGYFVTSPLFGTLADRVDLPGGRKRLIAAGVAVWSAATAVTGLARGMASLVASRAVVGVGEASYGTVAPTIIDDLAPVAQKGRWLAVFYGAIPVGAALGFAIGGILGKAVGWRTAFYFVGIPGIVAAASCLAIAEPVRAAAPEPVDMRRALKTLSAMPVYRRGVFGYAAQTFALGGFGYWAPTFLLQRYGLPIEKGGPTFGGILLVAGGIGTVFGGWWTDTSTRRAGAVDDDRAATRIALRICAISGAIAAPLAAACFWAPSPTLFFALGFACELALFVSTSPINAAVLRAVPREMRASAMAVSIFGIHLLGDLFAPALLGLAQDLFPAPVAMMGVPLAVAASAALWWLPRAPAGVAPEPAR